MAMENLGKLPLSFEANRGQSDEPVRFLARGAGATVWRFAHHRSNIQRDDGTVIELMRPMSQADAPVEDPDGKGRIFVRRMATFEPKGGSASTGVSWGGGGGGGGCCWGGGNCAAAGVATSARASAAILTPAARA